MSRDRRPPPPRILRYDLGDGWLLLVGRSDADNDKLSTRIARPNDYWFHVRGMPGSHVVLQGPSGEEPSRELLKKAASVAAHHSKARDGGVVAVSYTQAKNVSKPRGVPLGTVTIRRESVLKVRPTPGEDVGEAC
ncbi:MAG: DUF814 domain-containing protein [Deltaproteobacteria bacterium]|nr:DUF814 domain-containing protein [Deltaproteobacteria bacterium]